MVQACVASGEGEEVDGVVARTAARNRARFLAEAAACELSGFVFPNHPRIKKFRTAFEAHAFLLPVIFPKTTNSLSYHLSPFSFRDSNGFL